MKRTETPNKAGALLEQAKRLQESGIHPIRIAEGHKLASRIAAEGVGFQKRKRGTGYNDKQHIHSHSSLTPISIFTMADELQKTAQADDQVPVVNVTDVPQAVKTPVVTAAAAKEPPPVPESNEEPVKPKQVEGEEALETKQSDPVTNGDVGDEKVLQSEPKEEEAETKTVAVETMEQYPKKESINRVESGDTKAKVAPTVGPDSVEDDDAKTVEAIVSSVSSSVQPEQSPEAAK
ncbi:hypothetical protein F3Y22_tig00110503pilonHSYRG00143 [Hibiscus syriacus]|uniref:Uncharacterized protein n=1 Tax=Hibiscus syriacus TaxID=106335 RepID=A0A6A3AD02_HIBSY|nr:hypothetical protein F3Y22_tig00110503pilonHSYRG00143 [Hibiscus syriacus]